LEVRIVLGRELLELSDVVRPKRPRKLPVVLTPAEVRAVFGEPSGVHRLPAELLYGSDLRLMEGLRLRVKDLEFERREIMVRDGKGRRDRVTVLPASLVAPLRNQFERARALHERDLVDGFGAVYLPRALERKYRNAARELAWQWVFPSARRALDPGHRSAHPQPAKALRTRSTAVSTFSRELKADRRM
jgi:integrase